MTSPEDVTPTTPDPGTPAAGAPDAPATPGQTEPPATPPGFAPPSGSATGAPAPTGWGQPASQVGYGQPRPDQPRYGQYAPGAGSGPATPPSGSTPGYPPLGGLPGYPPAGGAPGYPSAPPPTGAPVPPPLPAYGASQYQQAPGYGGQAYGGPGGPGWRPEAAKPGIIPLRPLSLGEIYDGAFAAIRKNPKVMLGVVALVVSIATIIPTIISAFAAPSVNAWLDRELDALLVESGSTESYSDLGLDSLAGQLSQSVFVSIGLYLATIVLTGLLTVAISRSVINKSFTAGELWDAVKRKIGGLIVLSLLPSLGVLAMGLVLLALVAAAGSSDAAVGIVFLGMIALLVGAIWLVVRFLLASPAYVLEGQGLGSAIKRGWVLSKGSSWRLLGIYVLSSIITTIVQTLIASPGAILSGLFFDDATSVGSLVILGIAQILGSTISLAFLSSVVALLYIDVRMRREGLDVELAAAASEA